MKLPLRKMLRLFTGLLLHNGFSGYGVGSWLEGIDYSQLPGRDRKAVLQMEIIYSGRKLAISWLAGSLAEEKSWSC